MEAFLQKMPDTMSNSTIGKKVPGKEFGKNFLDSMEFDFTKFSGKRRRTKPKSPSSYGCSDNEIASPKVSIWDVYTKHESFAKRKMQIRSKSGLCDESLDEKVSMKPMTADTDDSTKEAASDGETYKAQLTASKDSMAYDSYDENQPDVVAITVTPKRLSFSESDESSNELSPSKEKKQHFTKSKRRETSDVNKKFQLRVSTSHPHQNCWTVYEDDSAVQPGKKLKLDGEMMFHVDTSERVTAQPKNKKKKKTKREDRRRQ